MAKLYYGNGVCNIDGEGSEVRGVQITYSGNVELEKRANDNFVIINNSSRIMIFPIGEGVLTDLFIYKGSLKVTSIIVAGNIGERVSCTVKRVMDYSELIESKSEDMTTMSENLNSTYNKSVRKLNRYDGIVMDQDSDGDLYLKDGTKYYGKYHIHVQDFNNCMTGCKHTEESQDLYFKQIDDSGLVINKLIPTKNPSSTLPALGLERKRIRKVKRKIIPKEDGHVQERKEPTRRTYTGKTTRKGGMGGTGGGY